MKPTIGYDSDWSERGGVGVVRRSTASARSGKIPGRAIKPNASSGIDWPNEPPVCVHGTRDAKKCGDCGEVICTHPGSRHVCKAGVFQPMGEATR